jgi:hypothetical protein
MPSPSGSTVKYGLPYLFQLDVPDIATATEDLAQAIENIMATAGEDILSNRPAAGKSGRFFRATDTNQTFLDDGTNWYLQATQHITKFTTSGSFVVPAGVSLLELFGVGGGAGGSGSTAGVGGGGGQPISRTVAVVPGETITFVRGNGGAAGTGTGGFGTAGTATTFTGSTSGLLLTCPAGGAGLAGTYGAAGGQNPGPGSAGQYAPPGYGGVQGTIVSDAYGGPEPLPGYGGGGGGAAGVAGFGLGGGVSGGNGATASTAAVAGAANTGGGGGSGFSPGNVNGAAGGSGYGQIKWVG